METVQAESHQGHLKRGFNWLGGAAIITKLVDFAVILVVLRFLSKDQVGLGALVLSVGMIVEALDGLGTSDALIQTPQISRIQLDTLFWFVMGVAVFSASLTLAVAPQIQAWYGLPGVEMLLLAVAIKQPIVAAAIIPVANMNRDLQYERIAMVNVFATFSAAMTRLVLAVSGYEAWALVMAHVSSGFYTVVGAYLARPFIPRLRFEFASIRPLVAFGMRASAANVFEQIFKNIDFLLVGWFYGPARLAVYRVAFDIAMEPAMAVSTLINRTALPVFARVAAARDSLAPSMIWALRKLTGLVAPLAVGLILLAGPLGHLLHDDDGHSYADAIWPLRLLSAAALLRVITQLLWPAMMAAGCPGMAARLSGITLSLLSLGIVIVGMALHAQAGVVAVSALWFAIYPPLLMWGACYLKRQWHIRVGDLLRTLAGPCKGIFIMLAIALPLGFAGRHMAPWVQIVVVFLAMGAAYASGRLHREKIA